ncbi:hypothetical protein QJS10_CPB18g00281 [Acorus calamus]|uniref:BHLH domain-containing protein n=1 Tax=Acorus calamus TaxID=4465 RepID=A0AAV9CJK5_ACOCL|nr:hypothetical protein QJS10_CPB18g00281 [Acorus calamus]
MESLSKANTTLPPPYVLIYRTPWPLEATHECHHITKTMRRVYVCGKRMNRRVVHLRERRPSTSASNMVPKKLMKLRKIVPECEEADVDLLIRRTAEYIALLEFQVGVLKGLSSLYGV